MSLAVIAYLTSLVLFVFYCIIKYKKRGYLLSIGNGFIFQYLISLFIIPPLTYSPKAWYVLLGRVIADRNAVQFYPYLSRSIFINCSAFAIFIIALITFEFNNRLPRKLYKLVHLAERNISSNLLDIEFCIIVVLGLLLTFLLGGGFRLLGGNKIGSESGIYYYVNMSFQSITNLLTFYYGINFVNTGEKKLFFALGTFICLMTGKRANIVMDVIWGVIIYYLYIKIGVKNRRKVIFKSFKYIIAVLLLAIMIAILRQNSDNHSTLIDSFFYGNTFSDIRDGAMILYGYENRFGGNKIMGYTYLSAILSFIPSQFLRIRTIWDWGRFSTYGLLGWRNHPGLRGGWGMEAYLNFGILGIIAISILAAYLFSALEKYFYNEMFKHKNYISAKSILFLQIVILLARKVTCSGGFHTVYVMLLFYIINIAISYVLKKNV